MRASAVTCLNCGPYELRVTLQTLQNRKKCAGHDRRPNELVGSGFDNHSLGTTGVLRFDSAVQNLVPPVPDWAVEREAIRSQSRGPASIDCPRHPLQPSKRNIVKLFFGSADELLSVFYSRARRAPQRVVGPSLNLLRQNISNDEPKEAGYCFGGHGVCLDLLHIA